MKKPFKSFFRSVCAPALAALCVESGLAPCVWAHGSYHDQVARLTAAIEKNPDDGWLWLQLANEKSQHGDWREALEDLQRIDPLADSDLPIDLVRGECLLQGERAGEARVALDRFLCTQPHHLRALVLRARASLHLAQTAAALVDYRDALASPGRLEPDHVQEAADAFAASGDAGEAIAILDRGVARFGAIPSLNLRALELELLLGRFDAALARIAALEKSAPRREPWMARRAEVLALAGRHDAAVTAWRTLVAHLEALPNLERGSHAMSRLAEDARAALRRLSAATSATDADPRVH